MSTQPSDGEDSHPGYSGSEFQRATPNDLGRHGANVVACAVQESLLGII